MEVLVALIGIAGIALVLAIIQIARYKRELRHMAQFLNSEAELTGARLTSEVHNKPVLDLARAINGQIDRRQEDKKVLLAKDRELREGFAYLSHDIRTPLMGARGYLQLALEEEDPAEALHYVKAVEERLGSLQVILDQLFLFTRVSSEGYALDQSEVALDSILSEVLLAHYPQFNERGWTPEVLLEDTLVQADPEALRRIFENLVVNMLRHGAGEPSIKQQGTSVSFANLIENPSELDTELLFERFYKGKESAHGKGSGLGLAIVSELAEAMDATIAAEVVEGSDDTWYLEITLTFKRAGE